MPESAVKRTVADLAEVGKRPQPAAAATTKAERTVADLAEVGKRPQPAAAATTKNKNRRDKALTINLKAKLGK